MAHLNISNTVISDRRLPLPGRVVVLGRSIDVDVPVPHRSVSRQHALIEETDDGFLISDLGSSNGTFIGEERLEERLGEGERRPVALGLPFRLGEVSFRLAADEVIEDEPELAPLPVAVSVAAAPAPAPVKVDVEATRKIASRKPTKPATRAKATPAQRAVKRKTQKDAMRWMGVLVTITLLTVAGLLLSKIVGMDSGKKPSESASETDESTSKEDRFKEVKTLKPPGEK